MPETLTACLSGPERTRAQAAVALEDARIPILPSDHYAVMGWHGRLVADSPSGEAFLSVLVRDAEQLNEAARVVESAEWRLRVHYYTPEKPQPSAEQRIAATLDEMRAEIERLKALVPGAPSGAGAA